MVRQIYHEVDTPISKDGKSSFLASVAMFFVIDVYMVLAPPPPPQQGASKTLKLFQRCSNSENNDMFHFTIYVNIIATFLCSLCAQS